MAGKAQIGALHVQLGLDSAQFRNGLKLAQGDVSRFGKILTAGFAGMALAATGAMAAFGIAVRGAAKHADALGMAAQKAGVTTQALSRLEYAARFSDVSLEELTGGLGKLSRAMVEASQNGGSQAASAFAALGVSIKDSSGNLRDSDAVFSDIASRFAMLEDGAAKTSLSMALFGKSGANLIPVLNEGADGLQRYADKADRLGITISDDTAKAADKFGDTIDDIGSGFEGLTNKVMAAALPAMQSFADTLASPEFQKAAMTLATNVIHALDMIVQAITGVINMLTDLGNKISEAYARARAAPSDRDNGKLASDLEWHRDKLSNPEIGDSDRAYNERMIAEIEAELARRKTVGDGSGLAVAPSTFDFRGWLDSANDNGKGDATAPDLSGYLKDLQDVAAAQKAANAEQQMWQDLTTELGPLLEGTRDPFQQLQSDLDKLGAWLQHEGVDGWEAYSQAVFRANANMVAAVAGAAGQLMGALETAFEGNKAIKAAGAVVDGIAAVAKTFADYGATPWGFALAGVMAATAAVNVANILSTTKSSKSMPGNSSSRGAGAGASAGSGAGAGSGQAITLVLKGRQDSGTEELADRLAELVKDGGGNKLITVLREAA
jgi:hypothetical protein